MFQSTKWILEEPDIADSTKYDLLVPTIVKPQPNNSLESTEIGIIHQFQFSSTLQRMSVVIRNLSSESFELFCKGSPEMIISLSKPETVPFGILDDLKEYTKKGYRVLSLGWRKLENINFVKIQKMQREEAERDLTFLGFIILENRLKPQTCNVINILKNANMRLIMITGDNIQTATSVARECKIIDNKKILVDVTTTPSEKDQVPALVYSVIEEAQEVKFVF